MKTQINKKTLDFRVSLLKDVIIFANVDDNTLLSIAESLETVELAPYQALFNKGDKSRSMYIVIDGEVKVHDDDYVFTTLIDRQFLGEYALLDEMERSASVTALVKTSLYELSKEDFDRITGKQPEIKDGILKALLIRLRERNDWEERLAQRNKMIQQQKDEIEKKNVELTKLNKEIQAQKDLKDRFFSIISHDLRGPVSSFQGISSIIRLYIKTKRFDDLIKMTEEIDSSAFQLSRLLDNLLNWASQQQSQIPYNPELIDISSLINNLFDVFKSNAVSKKILLHNQVEKETTAFVDVNTVRTIFRNLVNNALKYTEENGQVILSSLKVEDGVQIIVKDTGVGIPKDRLNTLFKLGDQKSTYGTAGEKGVGLGLQLVYEFTKLNKGKVEVESVEGEGTSFKVTLPRDMDNI